MKDYSYIETTEIRNPLGEIERMEYKWAGENPICLLNIRAIYNSRAKFDEKSKTMQIGPYRLKRVEPNCWGEEWIRVDYPFWKLVVFWHKANKILEVAYRRTLITLAVWNLAEYHEGYVPTYKDIYLIKKIIKLIDKPIDN